MSAFGDDAYPVRAITQREYVEPKGSRTGTGSVMLTLECGHRVRRHISKEPREAVRCEQCFFDQREGGPT